MWPTVAQSCAKACAVMCASHCIAGAEFCLFCSTSVPFVLVLRISGYLNVIFVLPTGNSRTHNSCFSVLPTALNFYPLHYAFIRSTLIADFLYGCAHGKANVVFPILNASVPDLTVPLKMSYIYLTYRTANLQKYFIYLVNKYTY
jgi:hypothetical protein